MGRRYTCSMGRAGAISVTPFNDNVQNERKRVFHLFNCLLCGQVISVEKTLKDERVMALDGLGRRVHICPSSIACPYCWPCRRGQQSPRRGFSST
jgi:hypothetical protein